VEENPEGKVSYDRSRRPSKFPRVQIESTLQTWWDQHTSSAVTNRRAPEECRRVGGTVFDVQPVVSAIEIIPVLLPIERLLGFSLPKRLLPAGGYNDRERFVRDVTSRTEAEYIAHRGRSMALPRKQGTDRG
jgi:hypothetical protein